jgi:lysophospholipase L1-like esterase
VVPFPARAKVPALVLASSLLAAGVGLLVLRLAVPRLFGASQDLKLLQLDTKVPAFFDNVFRDQDRTARDLMVLDPIVRLRGRPFYPEAAGLGPHDLLGFRNREVPNVADVVTIGDSFTYGNNAALANNWPSVLKAKLGASVYNLAMGGWGAVQYLDIFSKALFLEPRVAVVAFYSGNDALDSFKDAYGIDRFADLRLDSTLTANDMPEVKFPAPPDQWWEVTFRDGTRTTFSPELRLACNNRDTKAVRAGYAIMAEVVRRLALRAAAEKVKLVVTIIPTKELGYAPRIEREGIQPPAPYTALIANEQQNIAEFAAAARRIPGVTYVDLVGPLQASVATDSGLYPTSSDGHPLPPGYRAIGEHLAAAVTGDLPDLRDGFYRLRGPDDREWYYLYRNHQLWVFHRPRVAEQNGWSPDDARPVTSRDIARLEVAGIISAVDRSRFGPH